MPHPYEPLFYALKDTAETLGELRYLVQDPVDIEQQELDDWLKVARLGLSTMQGVIEKTRLAILQENPDLV